VNRPVKVVVVQEAVAGSRRVTPQEGNNSASGVFTVDSWWFDPEEKPWDWAPETLHAREFDPRWRKWWPDLGDLILVEDPRR